MAQMRQVSKAQGTLRINRFGGVDFSSNNTKADVHRSPDAVNMISDDLSYPVKRTGYKRVLPDALTGKVNGLYKYVSDTEGESRLIAHVGTKIYSFLPDGSKLKEITNGNLPMADHSSIAFNFGGKLYIIDGSHYFCYNGLGLSEILGFYDPITYTGLSPGGTGGTQKEARNFLSSHVRNVYNANGTSATYILAEKVIEDTFIEVTVNGEGREREEDFTFYVTDEGMGIVTFLQSKIPPAGKENVTIKYTVDQEESGIHGYSMILGCTICGIFGGKNDTRVFLSGNPNCRNVDWMSGLYDPTYFPTDGYTKVGSDATAIVGYTRQYDTQIIIKEDNDIDATQYLRTFDLDNKGVAYYPLQQGAQGAGAVAPRSFATLGDVPLFLSKTGVYGVMGTSVALQRSIQPKSTLINARLLEEPGLENAAAVVYDNKYYLCVNGHCYVADGNQRYTADGGGVQYEWYYWENIPATCFLEHDGYLYFGTDDGRVCRFYKSDEYAPYNDDKAIIPCRWTTPFLDFDAGSFYKTVKRVYVTLKPFTRTSADIYYSSDRFFPQFAGTQKLRIFNFEDIDFSYFSFNTFTNPVTLPVLDKARRVVNFQLDIRNSMPREDQDSEGAGEQTGGSLEENNIAENEALGIYGIQIDFQRNAKLKEV